VFVSGLLCAVLALGMAVFAVVTPTAAARPGLLGGAIGCGFAGAVLLYLSWPSGRRQAPLGSHRAKATILEAKGTPGSVAGYQMVELTLEVQPKDGLPFQVKRKFSAGRLGRVDQGRRLDVAYDPADPEKIELI
jgi:hypothetical protein